MCLGWGESAWQGTLGQSGKDSLRQQALTTLCGVSLELPRVGCEEEPGAEDRKLHDKKKVWTVGSTGIAAIE